MKRRKYIPVYALIDKTGKIRPLAIEYDGANYRVDRVLNVQNMQYRKEGGSGLRFACRFGTKERILYLEGNRWYIEEEIYN